MLRQKVGDPGKMKMKEIRGTMGNEITETNDAAAVPFSCGGSRTGRIGEVALFLLVLLACGWFFSTGGWNQISRYDAIFAFAENEGEDAHTFRIDRYLADPDRGINTGDWARYGGHYYSNKSPGTTVFGALVYAPLRRVELFLTGRKTISPDWELLNAWLLNLILSGLPLAFGAVCFRRLLSRFGASPLRADVFTILLVFGTGLWPYSTQLWALPATAAFLILSACFYFSSRGVRSAAAAAGASFGAAVLFDYTAGILIPAVVLGLLLDTRSGKWRRCLFFLLGGLPFAVIYLLYNQACFGSPFRFAFLCNNPAFVDAARTGGVASLPSLYVMLELLFGQYRGLFPAMPFLLFAIPGFLTLFQSGGNKRRIAVILAVAILSLLLMNGAFNGWHGGDAILSRYLIPSFPAWCFLAAAAPLGRLRSRTVFAVLALLSFCNMAAVTGGTPLGAPESDRLPVYRSSYRNLLRENMGYCSFPLKEFWRESNAREIQRESTTSLGERAGLSRRVSSFCFLGAALLLLFAAVGPWERIRQICAKERDRWKGISGLHVFRSDGFGLLLLLCCALYFLLPGDIYFINDEPLLLSKALNGNLENRFVTHGLVGTSGFIYGPIPTIFYQLCLMLIPHDLILIVLLKTALFLLAVGYSFHALFRDEKEHDGRLPFLFLLVSPYFYLYTRCLWDNVLLLPLTALFLLFLQRYLTTEQRRYAVSCAGVFLLCLLVHPMSASIGAASVVLFIVFRRNLIRKHWKMLSALAFCLILLAGSFFLLHRVSDSPVQTAPGLLPDLGPAFRLLSFHGFLPYFLPELSLPGPTPIYRILIVLSASICAIFLLLGVLSSLRSIRANRDDVTAQLGIFALLVLAAHVLLLLFFGKTVYPHYGMPLLIPAAFLCGLGADSVRHLRGGRISVLLYLAVMAALLFGFAVLNHRNGGGRGVHYGATLSNQLSVVRFIHRTAVPDQGVMLRVHTQNERLFPHALGFLYNFTQINEFHRPEKQRQAFILPLDLFYSGPEGTGFIEIQAEEAVPVGAVFSAGPPPEEK